MQIIIENSDGLKQKHNPPINFLSRLFSDLNEELWHWEYVAPPKNSTIITAKYDNHFVGHYACLNYHFSINGKIYDGAKAEGSLVDLRAIARLPKKNSKGLFLRLVRELLKKKAAEDCKVIFGFSNKLALPTQLEAGFSLIELPIRSAILCRDMSFFLGLNSSLLKYLLKPVTPILLAIQFILKLDFSRTNLKVKSFSKIETLKIDHFAKQFSLKNPAQITIHREANFYRWRFMENPYCNSKIFVAENTNGQIEGIAVFCQNKDNMDIIQIQDLIAINRDAIRVLLKAGIDLAKKKKSAGLEIWVGESTMHATVSIELRKLGFIFGKQQTKKMIVWYDSILSNVVNPSNWYVTMAFRRY